MSLTAKEFDKAIELNEKIREIKGCVCKLEHPNTPYFSLTWGNMYSAKVEQVAIPRELEAEIVQKIYEWYKNRLEQVENEFSKLVTKG